jgi:F0F1-type ATP synthase membrane subunit b/b'
MAKPARKETTRGQSRGQGQAAEGKPAPRSPSEGEQVSSLLETTGKEVEQLLEAADDAARKIREAAEAYPSSQKEDPGDAEVSSLIEKTNREVRQVLETADEAAEKIREDARAEARLFIEEAHRRAETVTAKHVDRVAKLSDEVIEELSSVRDHVDALRAAFERAVKSMRSDLGIEQTEAWGGMEENGAGQRAEETAELRHRLGRRRKAPAPSREPSGISEGARLLALQQLMAGVDAEVIEKRLKDEFGIDDPRPLLEWMGLEAPQAEKPKKR